MADTGTTSTSGSTADGVLGCYNGAASEITILQGWNWYAGANPAQIGQDQFDFQTTVTHEFGHALGLGHSADPNSPMFESLAPGQARRDMSIADLNIPEPPTGADPLTASGFGDHKQVVAPVGTTPSPDGLRATRMPAPTAFALGQWFLPVPAPSAVTSFQNFAFAPAHDVNMPWGGAVLFRNTVANLPVERPEQRHLPTGWSHLNVQPIEAMRIGDPAPPDTCGPNFDKERDVFSPPASAQRDWSPSDEPLPAEAVSRVFGAWEPDRAPIQLAPEVGIAEREAATANASSLAWAGVLAIMVGARVSIRQSAKHSPRLTLKR